jgi:hypothetical protein
MPPQTPATPLFSIFRKIQGLARCLVPKMAKNGIYSFLRGLGNGETLLPADLPGLP